MRCFAKRFASSILATPVATPANSGKFLLKPLWCAMAGVGLSALISANPAFAQTPATAPASAASRAASNAAGTPSDAARRAAESPYRWILINSTAPAKPKPTTAAAPAAATAEPVVAAAAPTTTRRTRAEAAEAAAATAAASAAIASNQRAAEAAPAPAAPPVPAPVVVAAAPPPPPPPVVREPLPLVAVKQDQPQLSSQVLREAPNGLVKVAFTVNADGSTSDAKIASSTNRRLNSAVLAAVALWRYKPIEEPRATEVEMAFKLE